MKLKIPTVIFILLGCYSLQSKAQSIETEFTDKSNSEIILELNNWKTQLDAFVKFEQLFGMKDDDTVTLKEELSNKIFNLQTSTQNALNIYNQLSNKNLWLNQKYNEDGKQNINIDNSNFGLSLEGPTYEIAFIPIKYHFHDGTIAIENDSDIRLNLYQYQATKFSKIIDRITFQLQINYINQMDSIVLDQQNNKYKNGESFIIIEQLKGNKVNYKYASSMEIALTEVLNESGKALDRKSYFSSSQAPNDTFSFEKLVHKLSNIITNANIDSTMDNVLFQKKYINILENEFSIFFDSDTTYYEGKYKGDANSIKFWIEKNRETLSKEITLKTTSSFKYNYYNGKNESIIADKNGKTLTTTSLTLDQISSIYFLSYEDGEYFLFDETTRKLSPLPYFDITHLKGEYVKIIHKTDDEVVELKNGNKSIGFYNNINNFDNIAIAVSDKEHLLIDPNGNLHRLDVDYFIDVNNGFIKIKKGNYYGFINEYGKTIIPATYTDVKLFEKGTDYFVEDELFPVLKNDKWGYVNAKNQTIIPFEYDQVTTFSYGE